MEMNQDIKIKTELFLKDCLGFEEIHLVGPMACPLPDKIKHPALLVDGGCDHQLSYEGPILKIGDGDSSTSQMDILLNPHKDFSDLSFALSVIKNFPLRTIHLWGFLGGRKDHEMINLGELHHWLKEKEQTIARLDHTHQFFSQGSYQLNGEGRFSLLALEANQIRLTGSVSYPLPHWQDLKVLSSLTLSNQAQGPFQLEAKGPILMIRD